MLTDSGICCPRRSALVRSRQLDRQIDDEIKSHLAEATAEYAQQGLSAEEARWRRKHDVIGADRSEGLSRAVLAGARRHLTRAQSRDPARRREIQRHDRVVLLR
jgi:hypothetical protein